MGVADLGSKAAEETVKAVAKDRAEALNKWLWPILGNLGIWGAISAAVAAAWNWLISPCEALGGKFLNVQWIAVALAVPVGLATWKIIAKRVENHLRPKLDWKLLPPMMFRGMEWTWSWDAAHDYAVVDASLFAFCPTCRERVTFSAFLHAGKRIVRFDCKGKCRREIASARDGTEADLRHAVTVNVSSRCHRMRSPGSYRTTKMAREDDPEKEHAIPAAGGAQPSPTSAADGKRIRALTAEQAKAEGIVLPAAPAPKTSEQLAEEMVDADREERDRQEEAEAIKDAAKRRDDMIDKRLLRHPVKPKSTPPDRVRFMGLMWENGQPHCPTCCMRLQPVMVGGGKSQLMNGCPNCKNPLTEPSAHAIEDMRERLLEQRLRQLGRDPAIRDASTFTDPTAGAPAQATGSDIDVHLPVDPDPMVAHGQSQRQKALAAHIMERHFPHLTDRRKVAQVDILRTCTDARWTLEEAKTALALLVETGRLARSGTKGGIRYHSAHNEVDWRTEFHGMRWRGVDWTWRVSAAGSVGDIRVTCPACSTPMYPTNAGGYDAVPLIVLTCDHCRQHFGPPFNGDADALLIRMQAEMQRRINVCEKGGYADAKVMSEDDHEPIDYDKVTTAREIAAASTASQPPEMPVLAGDQLVLAKQAAKAFQAHDLLIQAFGGKPAFSILTTLEITEKLKGTGRSEQGIAASLKYLQEEGLVTVLDRFSCTQVVPTEAGQKLVDDRRGIPESVREAARAARMAAYRVGEQPPAKVKPDASEPALTREILLHAFGGGNLGKPVFKDAAIAVMKTVGYEAPDVERVLSLMEAKNLLSSVTSASNGTTQYSLTTAGEKRAKAGT